MMKNARKGSVTIDFKQMVAENGYIKARQLLQQKLVEANQVKIKIADEESSLQKRATRIEYLTKLSKTSGEPTLENPVDKIMKMSTRPPPVTQQGISSKSAESDFDVMIALKRSLGTEELVLPQMNLDFMPQGLGETIFLQVI